MTKILAIDPDVEASGYAVLNVEERKFQESGCLNFVALVELMEELKQLREDVRVVVEAGYLNQSNWHLSRCNNVRTAAQIGNSTGRNHEVARKLVELSRDYFGLPTIECKPLPKCWRGKDRKISHDELVELTGYDKKKTNQDERDACLLAWFEAKIPLKYKVSNLCLSR